MRIHEPEKPRRFYNKAAVEDREGGAVMLLDGRQPKTPAGTPLVLPTLALAALVASEWEGQGEHIDFGRMPATRLAFTALDRTPLHHAEVGASIARVAAADVLLQRAGGREGLHQAALWGPWVAWAEEAFGVRLVLGEGVAPPRQPGETLARLAAEATALGNFALSALALAAGLYGSAILAFAVQRGAVDADTAFDLSRLEEAWQEAQWGVDAEAEQRTAFHRADATMLGAWFRALA